MRNLKNYFAIFILCFAFSTKGIAQNNNNIDTSTVNKLLEKSKFFERKNINTAFDYCDSALYISKQIKNNKLIAKCYLLKGMLSSAAGNYQKSIAIIDSGLNIYQELNNIDGIGYSNLHIGNAYLRLDDYKKSMEFMLIALDNFEKNKDLSGKSEVLNIIGGINMFQRDYDSALKYFYKSLKIANKFSNKRRIAKIFSNIGIIYKNKVQYDSALYYYNKSMEIDIALNDKLGESQTLNNIGIVYRRMKDYDNALKSYKRALKLKMEIGNPKLISSTLNGMSVVYNETKNYKTALETATMSLNLAGSMKTERYYALENIAFAYDMQKDYDNAIKYYKRYYELKDTLFDERRIKQMGELQTKYETEKKEQEIITLTKEKDLQKAESKNKTYFIIVLGLVILIAGIIVYYYIRNQKNKHRQKIIEERAKEAENQKKRFAKELHDGTGSNLTGIRLQLLALKDKIQSNGEFSEIIKEIDRTHQSVRLLSYQVVPPEFDNYTLDQATHDLVRRLTKTGSIDINYSSTVNLDWLHTDKEFQLEIYRIIQEALSNVIKHSEAKNVDIQLIQHETNFNLMIEDDGKGFIAESINKGLGLNNISQRTNKINGTLNIDSSPGNGTSLIIDFPTPKTMKHAG